MPPDLPQPVNMPHPAPPSYQDCVPRNPTPKIEFVADPLAIAVLMSWLEEDDE